jgi:predicted NBD/HSP70 family sugar kinase
MSRTKREVTIDNDGNLAAFGEARFGAAKGARDFLMISSAPAWVVVSHQRGTVPRKPSLGGEIGHIVIDLDGPEVSHGGHGISGFPADPRSRPGASRRLPPTRVAR